MGKLVFIHQNPLSKQNTIKQWHIPKQCAFSFSHFSTFPSHMPLPLPWHLSPQNIHIGAQCHVHVPFIKFHLHLWRWNLTHPPSGEVTERFLCHTPSIQWKCDMGFKTLICSETNGETSHSHSSSVRL